MMIPLVIAPVTDPDDVRLDDYRRLQDHTLRRRLEDAGRFFIVEGWEAVRRLLSAGWDVRSILVTEDKADRLHDLGNNGVSFPHYVASREVAEEVVGFDLHRGVIASAVRPEPRDWRAVAAAASRLAILEGINDHENLGAIFRSAAALGVEGILLAPTVPDPLYRRSVRVSMGAVLMVSYARVESWPGNLQSLKATGFTLVALTPDPSADLIESILFPTRIALLLGSESEGLTKEALAAADLRVRIGQSGAMDSLNVGHAAAIAFHHFGRGPG
ncbi:MAG: RNA methyltransferase [Acidimicrobiia bacterium]